MRILGAQVTLPEPDMMLEAMLEASDPASCYRVYFTKNAANTKDSTNSPFGKFLAKTNYDHTDTT